MQETNRRYFKKSDAILIAIILLVAILALLFMEFSKSKNGIDEGGYNYAVLSIDGKEVAKFNLAEYGALTTIDLYEDYHFHGKIELQNHEARFVDMDCPDKLCEKAGFVKDEMDKAICLPNRAALLVYTAEDVGRIG